MNGETMKDPSTTHRTGRHIRKTPAAPVPRGSSAENTQIDLSQYMDLPENHWAREYARALAQARLDLYNQDKWDNDMGWVEQVGYPENPFPKLFTVDDEGNPELTAEGELLMMNDPELFLKNRTDFNDWLDTGRMNAKLKLVPMTKKEALEADPDARWYNSTDDYMRALSHSTGIDERYWRDFAQRALVNMLIDDMKSDNPKYENALRNHFLKDRDDDEPYTPADTAEIIKHQGDRLGRLGDDREFRPMDKDLLFLMNGFVPFSARIAGDKEMRYKASPAEWATRILGDAGLLGLYTVAPELATAKLALMTGLGSKVMAGGARGIAARAGLRGVTGAGSGAAGWGVKNYVADPALDAMFGVGAMQAPADTRDLALEAALGGFNNLLSTQLLRGGKYSDNAFRVREMMAPNNPSMVSHGDIMDSFKVMAKKNLKKEGKRPGTVGGDEITNIKGSTKKAKQEFAGMPLAEYRDKFGANEAILTENFPELRVDLTPKEGGPFVIGEPFTGIPYGANTNVIKQEVRMKGSPYKGAVQGRGFEEGGKWTMDAYRATKPVAKVEVPDGKGGERLADLVGLEKGQKKLYEKAQDPQFIELYKEQNAPFFANHTDEELAGLGELASDAQIRGNKAAKQWFSGKPTVRNGEQFSGALAKAEGSVQKGNTPNQKSALQAKTLKTKSRYGTMDKDGNFVEGTKKQTKALEKATKKGAERKQMTVISKDALNRSRDYQTFGNNTASKLAGAGARYIATPFVTNNANLASDLIPYFVDFFGPRAEPIKYED